MRLTKVFDLYNKYNIKYFAGKLPEVDIVFVCLDDAYGYTISEHKRSCFILIAKGLKNSEVRGVLLHEMIHVEQVMRNRKMDHGRKFKMMAKRMVNGEARKTNKHILQGYI